jgi:hypothetical protein
MPELIIALSLCCGCRGTDDPKFASSDWRASLSTLGEAGTALYSFYFTGAPPGGASPHIAVHAAGAAAACARYTGSDQTDDYWFIDMTLSAYVPGTYSITTAESIGSPGMSANVSLLHRSAGTYAAQYPAVSGTVVLAKAIPFGGSLSDGGEQGAIDIDVDLGFPIHAVQQLTCRGGQAADSSMISRSCDCRDSNGVATTCEVDSGAQDCCIDVSQGTFSIAAHYSVAPCRAMCRTAVGLAVDYCALM